MAKSIIGVVLGPMYPIAMDHVGHALPNGSIGQIASA